MALQDKQIDSGHLQRSAELPFEEQTNPQIVIGKSQMGLIQCLDLMFRELLEK